MWAYIMRRLLLVIPTLLGIMVINFVIVQFAPGGPVDQTPGADPAVLAACARSGSDRQRRGRRAAPPGPPAASSPSYRRARAALRLRQAGARALPRLMMRSFATFDFGKSFFRTGRSST